MDASVSERPGGEMVRFSPASPHPRASRGPSPRGEGGHRRVSSIADSHFKQPAPAFARDASFGAPRASVSVPGNDRHPAAVRSCPPRNQSRRVKRRKALVRNAAPGGPPCGQACPFIGRDGRPMTRAGAPCGASPRCFMRALPHYLGPRLPPGSRLARPVVQLAPSTRVVLPDRRVPRLPESPAG